MVGSVDDGRVRVPTSVLLAVLAAAGLLALAPALVRRYDATERLEAERTQSTARVLARTRRPRSVPGRRPVNPSRVLVAQLLVAAPVSPVSSVSWSPGYAAAAPRSRPVSGVSRSRSVSGVPRSRPVSGPPRARVVAGAPRVGVLSVVPRSAPPARARRPRRPVYSAAVYRRRRVLAALGALNAVELIGVVFVGPGFWVGFAVTGTLLLAFLVHLRNLALADRRRRRVLAREAAWLAARQADVRREQQRRAAARRAAARRMAAQREALRRAAATWSMPPAAAAGGDGGGYGGGYGGTLGLGDPGTGAGAGGRPVPRTAATVSYRRSGGLRGRPYSAGGRSSA
jgi:hypothetical protein